MKKDRRLRILWSSNAPWAHSGYAVQTRDLLFRFLADGWENIACSCFYGLEGGPIELNGLKCYPKMGQAYGADGCYYHQIDYGADVVITFQDVWPMDGGMLSRVKNWIAYVPIDHDPVPKPVVERLKMAYRIVAFSKFGQEALERAGLKSSLILEGIDTEVFKPMDKIEQRKAFGLPEDAFIFGMVAANKDNPPRKSFQQVMDAFVKFRDNHKDRKCAIFFHTLLEQDGGFNIREYAEHLNILDSIYFPPPYHMMYKSPHSIIAKLMNAFDVFLNPSHSEGFGLPPVEAQACGVPVIVNDWTAMPEAIIENKTGWLTKCSFKRWSPITGYVAYPDTDSVYERMERSYNADRKKMAKDCRKHILENYDLEKRIKEAWIPFLEEVQAEILGPMPKEVAKPNE